MIGAICLMRGKFFECVSKSLIVRLTTRTPASISRRASSSFNDPSGLSLVAKRSIESGGVV